MDKTWTSAIVGHARGVIICYDNGTIIHVTFYFCWGLNMLFFEDIYFFQIVAVICAKFELELGSKLCKH